MFFRYKVEFSFIPTTGGNRARTMEIYYAPDCQQAVYMARADWGHLEEMRVERVWKENHGSWMAVNAWR